MSIKTHSHDVVCGFREAKIENSRGRGGSTAKVVWALFLEERDRIEGIWVTLRRIPRSRISPTDTFGALAQKREGSIDFLRNPII
jgi:hypothetical protein